MFALQKNYYGKSESDLRKQMAKYDLNKLFYRNETTFSFENYITKRKQRLVCLIMASLPFMRRTSSYNSWITKIHQTTI